MALTQNPSAFHMIDNPDIYEPHRSNTFQLIVTNLGSLLKPGSTGQVPTDYITDGQDVLRLSVVTANIPDPTINVMPVRRGNSVMKAAGLPAFDDGSVTLREYEGTDAANVLYAWKQLVYNQETDTVGKMSAYKKDCYLVEYNVDKTEIVRQYLLKGCWVSSISREALTVESEGPRTITVTMPFDTAKMILSDEE